MVEETRVSEENHQPLATKMAKLFTLVTAASKTVYEWCQSGKASSVRQTDTMCYITNSVTIQLELVLYTSIYIYVCVYNQHLMKSNQNSIFQKIMDKV